MKAENFNNGWLFHAAGENTHPRPVDLPHDAMIEEERIPDLAGGDTSGFYPGGKYVYEKSFIPGNNDAACTILHFDGVYQKCRVFLNGTCVGGQIYGYTNFDVPLTEALQPGRKNHLRVEVDNTQVPNARWYTGSGIYRDVTLYTGPRVHIVPGGVRVETLAIDPLRLKVRVEMEGLEPEEYKIACVKYTISDAEGNEVPVVSEKAEWNGGVCTQLLQVGDAALWSEQNPALYTMTVALTVQGEIDTVDCKFGIRMLTWNPESGMQINGETVKLRGACLHHDNGMLGAKEYRETAFRRIRILKECGYNAVRTAHNEPSEWLLKACDALGMYVMAEFADVWRASKNQYDYSLYFDDHAVQDLTRMVHKCAVHPSVVMYSLGNEVYDTKNNEAVTTCKMLAQTVRKQDTTRPLTLGFNILGAMQKMSEKSISMDKTKAQEVVDPKRKGKASPLVSSKLMNTVTMYLPKLMERVTPQQMEKNMGGLLDVLDIAGLNYGTHLFTLNGVNARRMIVNSETFPAHIGRSWPDTMAHPWVVGDFMWTGWDYLGECGLGVTEYGSTPRRLSKPYPCVSAGIGSVNLAGEIEAQGYYTKAVYGLQEKPYIAVHPLNHAGEKIKMSNWRGTDAVNSWAWGDTAKGKVAAVDVYCSASLVELFQNGAPLGMHPVLHGKASWYTTYRAGTLEAVAYNAQKQEVGRSRLESGTEAERLHIYCEPAVTAEDTLRFIHVEITDERGIRQVYAEKDIQFAVQGAELLGVGSGSPWAVHPFTGKTTSTWYGTAAAVVRLYKNEKAVIRATAEGLEPSELTLQA